MRQLLLLIFVFFASQWLFKKLKRAQTAAGPRTGPQTGPQDAARASRRPSASASPPQLPDPLVRCAECGVHTPSSEAIVAAGHRFCCGDHARRYAGHPTGRDAR